MTLITRGAPRMVAAALTLAISFGGILGAQASARPPARPAAPADLSAKVTLSAGTYQLSSTWTAAANATTYKVAVTNSAGSVLGSATVTKTAWSGPINASVGSLVKVTVTSYNNTRKGLASTVSVKIPDLTAPTGSFSATWAPTQTGATQTVTFAANNVTDDASSAAQIAVSIDWGDGTPGLSTTASAAPYTHDYQITTDATRYQPVITLTDAAGNTSTAPVNAVVVSDTTAPTVTTASLGRTTAWAKWTQVSLTQAATDNVSPAANVTRTVDWGDGTVQVVKGDSALSHVYAAAGTYPVSVTASDEAQPANTSATTQAGTVTVAADTFRPTVGVIPPAVSLRTSVAAWRVIHGYARDAQTGVRNVRVRVVERRGSAFYAYRPSTHTWVKSATLGAAYKNTRVATVGTKAGKWQVGVRGLRIGRLYVRVTSIDNVGNVSLVRIRQQALTRS